MLITAGRIDELRRFGWLCLPVVPLACIAFEAAFSLFHSLNYTQYFNDACGRFGEFYPATPRSGLMVESAIWLVPALPLLFLWRKRRVVVFYAAVCIFFALLTYEFVTEDLASHVNCYRRIGTGEAMIELVLLLQTFLLLACTLVVFIRFFVRRFSYPVRRPARSSAP